MLVNIFQDSISVFYVILKLTNILLVRNIDVISEKLYFVGMCDSID
jgi:hypothetical protein